MSDPIRLDLSKVSSFSLVEPGEYPAHIFEVKTDVTKNAGKNPAGTPKLNVRYKIDGQNASVFETIVLGETTMWQVKRLAVAGGVPEDEMADIGVAEIIQAVTGQPVVVTVDVQAESTDANGRTYDARNTVKKVVSADGYTPPTQGSQANGFF